MISKNLNQLTKKQLITFLEDAKERLLHFQEDLSNLQRTHAALTLHEKQQTVKLSKCRAKILRDKKAMEALGRAIFEICKQD